jgi:transcriptional regulator
VYTPSLFRVEDPAQARALMRRHPFAIVVTTGAAGLQASHLPLLVRDEPLPFGSIIGHMARANPHWQELEDRDVLVIFNGAHAYVSPGWYAKPDANVPTWSYVAVHAYGKARAIHDPERLRALVDEQVGVFEAGLEKPWRGVDEKIDRLLGGIVGFEMVIERLEGKMKVGQNRDADDRAAAAAVLAGRADEGSRDIAAWMRELGLV